MQRLRFNTRLGQILGGFGGREQTPEFIQRAFDLARQQREYTPGAEFIEPARRIGGGFGDYLGDILNPRGAAGYFDVERYRQSRQQQPQAQAPTPSQPAGGGFAQNLAGLLPSNIRRQQFNLGPTPAAEEFLQQRRQVPGR
jgi:hypothetical protein